MRGSRKNPQVFPVRMTDDCIAVIRSQIVDPVFAFNPDFAVRSRSERQNGNKIRAFDEEESWSYADESNEVQSLDFEDSLSRNRLLTAKSGF